MLVVIKDTYEEVSKEATRIVEKAVRARPNLTLGLATGGTPLAMYRELIRLHREEGLDFTRVVTFNLDEYLGLPADHPQSYRYFMHTNFFQHINISPKNIHIPDCTTQRDYEVYCEQYEDAIRQAGGIDLQILGIGQNGHIGFNEPTSSLASRTRVKTLTKQTVDDNRRFFRGDEDIPQCAITMGIGTILEARRILLIASGTAKAKALAKAIEGPITASVTASALQLHRDVTIICDEGSTTALREEKYYKHVLETTYKVTLDRLW